MKAFSLIFYTVMKKFKITYNSVMEIQNLIVIHESQPVKSNSVQQHVFFGTDLVTTTKNLKS